ncbi:MAG: class I SAM-dependent methyltransferase [Planctomycetes bacterium]|nr:class I SAM-dependent methyltransferase [Planctomycetota bacterium]
MTRSHNAYTRRWLEDRFARTDEHGVFVAHMPIYGHRDGPADGGRLPRLARAVQILRALDEIEFASFLDVGCAEGYLAWVVRRLFGARVAGADLSIEACRRAGELFDVDACACDAERLPFRDGAFDVVLCSETIEHVEHPLHVMLELQRVARRAVVFTTAELQTDRAALDAWLRRRCGYPHSERNAFHPDDLRAVFGGDATLRSQFLPPPPREPLSDDHARRWLCAVTPDALRDDAVGVVVRQMLDPAARRASKRFGKSALCDALLAARIPVEPLVRRECAGDPLRLAGDLVDPLDHRPLRRDGDALFAADGTRYSIAPGGIASLHSREHRAVTRDELVSKLGDASMRATALALHDALVLPEIAGRTTWDLAQPADRAGWRAGDQLVARDEGSAASRRAWCFRSTGGDPNLVGPTMASCTDDVLAFAITMRIANPAFPRDAGVGQLFWICVGDVTFREEASVLFPVINDGEFHEYVVDPRTGRGWPTNGDLICIRLDPVDGPCEFDLARFEVRLRS